MLFYGGPRAQQKLEGSWFCPDSAHSLYAPVLGNNELDLW